MGRDGYTPQRTPDKRTARPSYHGLQSSCTRAM